MFIFLDIEPNGNEDKKTIFEIAYITPNAFWKTQKGIKEDYG